MGHARIARRLNNPPSNATIRHIRADSRLAVAKLIEDSRNLIDLEQLVDSLLQERIAAVRAYQEHVDAHAKKAVVPTHSLSTPSMRKRSD